MDASELAADCEALGLPPPESTEPPLFPLLPENLDTVTAWLTIETQMTPHGLRYEGVRAGLRLAHVRCTPALFQGLRVMEAAAIEAWSERRG